jgi:hypothetical protein
MPNQPIKADSLKWVYGVLAVVSALIAVLLFFDRLPWRDYLTSQEHFFAIVASVILAFFFGGLCERAYEAEHKQLVQKTEIKTVQMQFKTQLVRERQIEKEAELELELMDIRRDTEAKSEITKQRALETAQRELELQNHLIGIGIQQGLQANDVSEINKHKYLKDVDLEVRWKEITQDLNAGDLLDIADQQLVKNLTGRLEEWYRHRYSLSVGNDPEEVKSALLARYDKNIRYLEAKLDAQQAGLVLPSNGKEVRRIAEGSSDSRTTYSPETSEDAE